MKEIDYKVLCKSLVNELALARRGHSDFYVDTVRSVTLPRDWREYREDWELNLIESEDPWVHKIELVPVPVQDKRRAEADLADELANVLSTLSPDQCSKLAEFLLDKSL